MIVQKLRLTFAKKPELRFLSHHDVMRAFHRALRRADLPVRMTEGYNQRPRVVFPHALEVGIPSEEEVVEIELSEWVPPAEFASRIADALPKGLEAKEVKLAPPRRQGSIAVEAHYRAHLDDADAGVAPERVAAFKAALSCPYRRSTHKGGVREIDLRPHVRELESRGSVLTMRLRLGQAGGAKPREVLAAVFGRPVHEMLAVPLVKVRTILASPK